MKKILSYISTAILALCTTGCAKFLDVNPKGETFDSDLFETAEGYEDAIYGIYSEVSNEENLYAGYLHWIPEALCQNISCEQVYQLSNLQVQDWNVEGTDKIISEVWEDVYKCINHINNILMHIEKGGEEEFEFSRLYKGEMLAMRALLHFEMLHLLCPPVWAPEETKKMAIPYVRKYSFDITPFSSFQEAYDLVLEDLKEAERCLAQDEELMPRIRDNKGDGFTSCRNTHLNLYAVQGLIARVYWTLGQLDQAATYAEKVIRSGKFGFRPASRFVQPDNGTLDMDETLFGLYSPRNNYLNFKRYSPVSEVKGSFLLATDWKTIYEQDASASMTDLRLNAWFNAYNDGMTKLVNKAYYDGSMDANNYNGPSILGVNLIRLPEMYFIVAEANLESDPGKARDYFNEVIRTRGLEPLEGENAVLTRERLFRERRKEFYGEGITWYDMKNAAMDVHTVRGTTLDGQLPSTYTIKLPDNEFEGRDNIK